MNWHARRQRHRLPIHPTFPNLIKMISHLRNGDLFRQNRVGDRCPVRMTAITKEIYRNEWHKQNCENRVVNATCRKSHVAPKSPLSRRRIKETRLMVSVTTRHTPNTIFKSEVDHRLCDRRNTFRRGEIIYLDNAYIHVSRMQAGNNDSIDYETRSLGNMSCKPSRVG